MTGFITPAIKYINLPNPPIPPLYQRGVRGGFKFLIAEVITCQ